MWYRRSCGDCLMGWVCSSASCRWSAGLGSGEPGVGPGRVFVVLMLCAGTAALFRWVVHVSVSWNDMAGQITVRSRTFQCIRVISVGAFLLFETSCNTCCSFCHTDTHVVIYSNCAFHPIHAHARMFLWFNILAKNTSTGRLKKPGIKSSTLWFEDSRYLSSPLKIFTQKAVVDRSPDNNYSNS